MSTLRIALGQMDPTLGDLTANAATISRVISDAKRAGAHLVALPELALMGYPPEDLVLNRSFVEANLHALKSVAEAVHDIVAIVGFVDRVDDQLFNAAAVIGQGKVVATYHKHLLPNYGVFDEQRYFHRGGRIVVCKLGDILFGVTVCEDLWGEDGPHMSCVEAGARLIVNINASPYHRGKGDERQDLLKKRSIQTGAAFAYVNMVGGQDELVFDGQSCVVDADGQVVSRAGQFCEEILVTELNISNAPLRRTAPNATDAASAGGTRIANAAVVVDLGPLADLPSSMPAVEPRMTPIMSEAEEVYSALVLGVRDYLGKNGFKGALIGISGGIDSALTAAIAVDAIGADNVIGISNPSEYTATRSVEDAQLLAANLGFALEIIPITEIFESAMKALTPVFADSAPNVAEENLQARIRGMIWMAISNKFGRIVLSTGNKSEMAVGYATLYGDMSGGFAVLKDVPKTLVYALCNHRNSLSAAIPPTIIERPPTAELRPGQLDTDSLPPYEILDPILEAYIEDERSVPEMVAMGFDEVIVRRITAMVDAAEYKRRQAPPGIKVTNKAFGRDRRLPITNRFRPYA
ncbi:MAG: NAD+ synthase [Actinomycetota bacterium]|nr:NAD+ synthase [Actinomycetota bacterium]